MEFCVKLLSLPLWERGLKSLTRTITVFVYTSLPLWERGLKCIDTVPPISSNTVAPLVGAWIEIPNAHNYSICIQSLPLWERGLKLSS